MRPFDFASFATYARIGVAAVWIGFGLGCKLLRLVPRHEHIVARILGGKVAPVLTRLIGVGEIVIGAWMLSGVWSWWCALAQTVLVVTMNAIELAKAGDLLLAPVPMILGNGVLLAVAWYAALHP